MPPLKVVSAVRTDPVHAHDVQLHASHLFLVLYTYILIGF